MVYQGPSGPVHVFSQISFEAAPGERLAITGASGSGKSTLLHLLGGLDRPVSGRVLFSGRDIFSLGREDIARYRNAEIGYVWQQPSLLPEFTAQENVAMPLLVRGMDRKPALARSLELLEEVGLGHRAAHRSGQLSGGEQQRVALARALSGKPAVLLADEPTGNLDYVTGQSVAALLDQMHREHGLTSILVTHNPEFAKRCDRVLELNKGGLTPAYV
jgi:lipoprotein-releasing system ATP-binding protein